MSEIGFAQRLTKAIIETSPLCVGLDPSRALLEAWGLPDDARGLRAMAQSVLEAASGLVAAIKPQVAYFERHGSAGIAVLEVFLAHCREQGIITIADAKRGDIDSTMAAYGEAWVGQDSPLRADALTVTPYMGLDAMQALFDLLEGSATGIFCVVASSNPEGRGVQTALIGEHSVETVILGELAQRNREFCERTGASVGPYGAVIGASRETATLDLSGLQGCFLVPGFGAQGVGLEGLGPRFVKAPGGTVLVTSSRAILSHGPSKVHLRAEIEAQSSALREALDH